MRCHTEEESHTKVNQDTNDRRKARRSEILYDRERIRVLEEGRGNS